VAWFLVASGMVFLTWNRVVAELLSLKKAKFWQAVLVVGTCVVLCGPKTMMQRKHYGHGKCCGKASCPLERGSHTSEPAPEGK